MKKNLTCTTLLILLLICSALAVSSHSTLAQSGVLQFSDYPAGDLYSGRTAPLVLTRSDQQFKTRLRSAAKMKPNFAGHYVLTTWGCGSGCVMGAVIDVKTGKVYYWDFSVCCWPADVDTNFKPIEFRPNSRLVVFSGLRNEKEGDDGTHFYRFDENGKFVEVKTIPR